MNNLCRFTGHRWRLLGKCAFVDQDGLGGSSILTIWLFLPVVYFWTGSMFHFVFLPVILLNLHLP